MISDLVRKTIDDIGGNAGFADWFGHDGVNANTVSMWKDRGRFPSHFHHRMPPRLRDEFGIDLPPEAWGQK
jgi:hypothetical protein